MGWLDPETEWRKVCSSGHRVYCKYFTIHPSLSLANASGWLIPCHSAALDLGELWPEKGLDCETEVTWSSNGAQLGQ